MEECERCKELRQERDALALRLRELIHAINDAAMLANDIGDRNECGILVQKDVG